MKHNIYFADLAPLRSLFATGVPVLCYHKVGRKPLGVKLRGIYVSAGLFARQMRQLRAEGYRTMALSEAEQGLPSGRRVVITFDDGSTTVFRHAMDAMARVEFHAINFLVSGHLGGVNAWDTARGEVPDRLMDEAQVREWLAAGHEIGAHTCTHPRLSKISLAQAREEIFGSKKSLEDRFGIPMRHFCYPYGDYSPEVRDLVEEAGFETAVTTDAGVWRARDDRRLIPRIGARAHSRNFRNFFKWILGRPLMDATPLLSGAA